MVKKGYDHPQGVWPHLKIFGYAEDNSVGDSERDKQEMKTGEEI